MRYKKPVQDPRKRAGGAESLRFHDPVDGPPREYHRGHRQRLDSAEVAGRSLDSVSPARGATAESSLTSRALTEEVG